MLQSLAILYAEHALAGKVAKFSAILQTEVSSIADYVHQYRNRLLGVVRSTGALFRATS